MHSPYKVIFHSQFLAGTLYKMDAFLNNKKGRFLRFEVFDNKSDLISFDELEYVALECRYRMLVDVNNAYSLESGMSSFWYALIPF